MRLLPKDLESKARHLAAIVVSAVPDVGALPRYTRWIQRVRGRVIGAGVRCRVGRDVRIGQGFKFSRHMELDLGNGCVIEKGVTLTGTRFSAREGTLVLEGSVIDAKGGVSIGAKTQIGRNAEIHSHRHVIGQRRVPVLEAPEDDAPVAIGSDVMLFSNVRVIGPVAIEDGAVVGNSAVVTRNLDKYGIYAGVPARKVGERK